ncbi:MAG: transcription elongation factor GreA [Bacteroidetes bacterium 4572_112]|nr:MAG: transcription elongation factor GreA [Bacteroidetes bacterium 4572_112]
MSEIQYFSEEGLQKLKDELEHLTSVEKPMISAQIGEAIDMGDLSENAEYDAAKEAQGLLELKINKLQTLLVNARIFDESRVDTTKILLLAIVTIKNLANGKEMKYTIVPEKEADIKAGKLSINSPIAKGLLGKSVGDTAEIQVPSGVITFEVIKIER